MGFLDGLFSTKQTQNEKTSSSQEGQSSTQSNLWPQLQPFLNQYQNQFSDFSGANTPVNAYQTGAADQQSGVAGSLTGAFGTAGNVANEGISAQAIQSYMDPYIQSVVNPTLQAQNIQNQQAVSNLRGNQAVRGALGNNTGSEAAYYAGVQPGQQAQIASLYSQGYGQAVNTAAQNQATKLQGAQTQGQLASAQTGANTAYGNLGQNVWNANYQNNLTPYQIANMGVTGLGGLGGLAGSNTQSSGTATGTSNTTGMSSPGLGTIGAGLLGAYLGGLGGKADGGAVTPQANDGLHEKVSRAFDVIQELKKKASGGAIEPYADGGDVGLGSWAPTVTPTSDKSMIPTYKNMGAALSNFAGQNQRVEPLHSSLGEQQGSLNSFLSGLNPQKGYDGGGAVAADQSTAPPPTQPSSQAEGLSWKSFVPTYSTGVWSGEQFTPMQRLGAALTQVGAGNPFAGFGKTMFESNDMRLKQMEQERQNRALSLEAAANPSKIELMNAQAAQARVNADKNFLLEIEKQKAKYAKELELAQMQAKWDLYNKIVGPNGGAAISPGTYNWVPSAPNADVPGTTVDDGAEDGEP